MGHLEITGKSLRYLFWAVSLTVVVPLVIAQFARSGGPASIAVAVLLVLLLLASAVALWRRRTGRDPEHLGSYRDDVYDIANDPLAHWHGGRIAKDRWERAVNRLPGGDDEDD